MITVKTGNTALMQDVSHEILILHTQSKPKVNNPITQYSVMIMMK